MSTWFRFYAEVLDDPKIQKLPNELLKSWLNLLCLTAKCDGVLPPCNDIAFALRITPAEVNMVIDELRRRGLIDKRGNRLQPHNWDERQYKSDTSTERVKRFRKRKRNVSETANETDQSRTDTDTEQNRTENTERVKRTFGEFDNVKLSDGEQQKLIGKFGDAGALQRIENLSEYLASKGVKYSSHYATILSWDRKNGAEGNGNGKRNKTKAEITHEAGQQFLRELDGKDR